MKLTFGYRKTILNRVGKVNNIDLPPISVPPFKLELLRVEDSEAGAVT